MSVTPDNAVQSRDFDLFSQLYASDNDLPADSAAQTSPGGSWVSLGGTDGGIDVRMSATYSDGHVDQNIYPIYTVGTAGDLHFLSTLAEITPANLQLVSGQGDLATVAPGSGTRGHVDLTIGGAINVVYRSLLYQIKNATGDGEDIRILLRRALAKASPQPKFTGTAKAALPMDFQGYPDPNNSEEILVWRDISSALP